MSSRVLIVDDSSMMRKMIAKVLQPAGHEVVGEARNGLEAVEMFASLRPDYVTMDITMRDMDGLTAAREILRMDPGARIIFLSNLDEGKYHQETEGIGAIGFVSKHKAKDILDLMTS